MFKNFIKNFCLFFLLTVLFIFIPPTVHAEEEECDNMTIDIIARNDDGEAIRDLSFTIYEQTTDVDGNDRPGTKVSSGKIDTILGKGSAEFKPQANNYVLSFNSSSNALTAFYFYNAFQGTCGTHLEMTKILSGIKFTLRDSQGVLRKNTKFSVYLQGKDADGNPITEKSDLIASLDSGETGEATIYVPDKSRTIDGKSSDYFIFESKNSNGGIYTKYDISVSDEYTTNTRYVFSDMELELKDSSGYALPLDTQVELYIENTDGKTNEEKLGTKLKTIGTDGYGKVVFEYPAGRYAARIKNASGQYQYYFNLQISDQKRRKYELSADSQWEVEEGLCESNSVLTLITRNHNGQFIPGLKYELYEQTENADNIPSPGKKISGGTIDSTGKGISTLKPDPSKTYTLKIYDQNANTGDFWFFNELKFSCGKDLEITKKISAIEVILRDADQKLIKNHKFSLYTQKYDVDNNPIKEKEDLVSSSFTTSEEGVATIYVAPYQNYMKGKHGRYVFSASGEDGGTFISYDIQVNSFSNVKFEYIFSDAILKIKNPDNSVESNASINIYEQGKDLQGNKALGSKIKTLKTDQNGEMRFEYPAGKYALVLKDDLGKDNIFWDIEVKDRQRNNKEIIPNLSRIKVFNANDQLQIEKISIEVYDMLTDENGLFYANKKIKTIKPNIIGNADVSLAPNAYVLMVEHEKKKYGVALYTQNGIKQDLNIYFKNSFQIISGQKFKISKPENTMANAMGKRLKGRILLQVEERGEAWYVDIKSNKRYYMKNGYTAYEMMRKFGLGITNADLEKIPVGIDDRFNEGDADGDGVHDKMEEALGTDPKKTDTDGDGYSDFTEIRNGYNPKGSGKKELDNNLAEKLKGNILLQVESRGEAWYINPDDGKRYYMKDGDSAYEIMRFLSLGITNADLGEIEEGELE